VARKRVDWVPASVVWSEDADAVLASDVDVIVELAGGLDPAGSWVRRALEAGKSVVTANKKLIAYQGVELERLAAAKGGHLKYGAAVAGGIPVIPGLEQGMAGDRIERIEGILNGTCNFILSKMEEGAEYAAVLAEAQAKGYAEADPTEDVGGFDARAKLAILMRLALRVQVDPEEIVPRPITTITPVDFSYARDLGCTIRQVRAPSRSRARSRPPWDPCWWRCVRRWPGRGALRTWSSLTATTAAMWSFPATARAAIPRRWPWSAICWRWRTARGASSFPPLRRA
jgi:homoserine dehydrogenase